MNMLDRFLHGFSFRSAYPSFEEGQRITAYMTGYSDSSGQGIMRVGDTTITVRNASPEMVGRQVTVEINSFHEAEHRGTAVFLDSSAEE